MYLEQMEEIYERWARQLEERELDIHIREMHAHMRGTEEEEEKGEEEKEEELAIREWELEKRKKILHAFQVHSVVV
jgi:hypothetical protein